MVSTKLNFCSLGICCSLGFTAVLGAPGCFNSCESESGGQSLFQRNTMFLSSALEVFAQAAIRLVMYDVGLKDAILNLFGKSHHFSVLYIPMDSAYFSHMLLCWLSLSYNTMAERLNGPSQSLVMYCIVRGELVWAVVSGCGCCKVAGCKGAAGGILSNNCWSTVI